MNVRKFIQKDHEAAQHLVASGDMVDLPDYDDLGGHGLVLEKDGKVIGFIWALYSGGSTTALIDYFTVDKNYRETGLPSMMLITKMMLDLGTMGIKRVVGIVKTNGYRADALARIYHSFGMDVAPSYVIMGDISGVVNKLTERLTHGFIKTNDNHPKA